LVVIGSSASSNTVTVEDESYRNLDCPAIVDRSNWEVSGTYANYGDTFAITVDGAAVTAERTDGPDGWVLSLIFYCTRSDTVGLPMCMTSGMPGMDEWDAGYGNCDTYDSDGGNNHDFCTIDCVNLADASTCATSVCSECGACYDGRRRVSANELDGAPLNDALRLFNDAVARGLQDGSYDPFECVTTYGDGVCGPVDMDIESELLFAHEDLEPCSEDLSSEGSSEGVNVGVVAGAVLGSFVFIGCIALRLCRTPKHHNMENPAFPTPPEPHVQMPRAVPVQRQVVYGCPVVEMTANERRYQEKMEQANALPEPLPAHTTDSTYIGTTGIELQLTDLSSAAPTSRHTPASAFEEGTQRPVYLGIGDLSF
jgi:hypothetical protein